MAKADVTEYTLFLGCMIPLRHPQIEAAARKALSNVGVKVIDVDGFSCCPEPWNVKGASLEEWLAVAMRNLAIGEKTGRDMLVLCNGCYATLTEAARIARDGSDAKEAAAKKLSALNLSYKGKSRARHVASVLFDIGPSTVASSVKKPLAGMKVAVHYGCHLLRPADVTGFDDPFKPSKLEALVEALGAQTVRYSGYTDCCGRATRDSDASLRMANDKIESMKGAGAECVVTVCPACFEQFDLGQIEIKRLLGREHNLPVFHYLQLLALAQGEDASSLGLKRHHVNVEPALSRIKT